MVLYENSKIYKLWCAETDMIYIGSTTTPLYKRLYEHKHKSNICRSCELFKLSNDVKIELIENYKCNNKEELCKREGELIRENKEICVNLKIAGRTRKEYREENKEKLREQNKEYYENNKERIKEYHKEYQKEYYETHKERIKEYDKIYRETNKETIKEQKKEYYLKKKEQNLKL